MFGDTINMPLREHLKRNMAGGAIAGGVGGLIAGGIRGAKKPLSKSILSDKQKMMLLAGGLGLGGGMLAGKLKKP